MTVKSLCPPPSKDRVSCSALERTDVTGHYGVSTGTPADPLPDGYSPADLRSAYDLPESGANGTVAVVDPMDDPTAEADLAVYRQQYGLPPCTTENGCFRKVDSSGGTNYPPPDAGFAAQTSIDLDMVSAICPYCHLLLVEADSSVTGIQPLGMAVNEAVALGAKYVVLSWGLPDDSSGETDAQLDSQYFDHPGVAITAATEAGLNGTGGNYEATPLYPAASEYVTAVGGTTLTRDGSTPRGWSETVWNNLYGATLSGCSVDDPKPAFQTDTGCTTKTVADVAAVADPYTGVAAYDSYQNTGWGVYGGTGAAASIVAAIYALAGTPRATDNPASYPYLTPSAFNKITTGFDGPYPDSCLPAYLCDAGPGYNGPTGVGTPHGLAGFAPPGPHGDIVGQVTDGSTGRPAAGVTVQAGPASVTTGSDGSYDLWVPAGAYRVTVSGFGFSSTTVTGVKVSGGGRTTRNIAASALPEHTISGEVTDAGHGWPVYAQIMVPADPVPVYTDPFTGRYSVSVPDNASYTLQVTSEYPGFPAVSDPVTVGSADVTSNPVLTAAIQGSSCPAPGYSPSYQGLPLQTFDSASVPAGWSVQNASYMTNPGWVFDNPTGAANQTGGTGNFAVTSLAGMVNDAMDSFLVTPVVNLTGVKTPVISFDSYMPADTLASNYNVITNVGLSTDGGTTWTNVASNISYPFGLTPNGPLTISIPQAAGQSSVQVRFEFDVPAGAVVPADAMWELDDVYVGSAACAAQHGGGIVAGQVTDANTGTGIDGATVTGTGVTAPATSAAVPGDPSYPHGFYWTYFPLTGKKQLSAAAAHYAAQTASVTVGAGVTKANLALKAGRLVAEPGQVDGTATLGHSTSATVTVANTGTAPATITVVRRAGGVSVLGQQAETAAVAPRVIKIPKGSLTTHALVPGKTTTARLATAGASDTGQWTPLTDYPFGIADNATVEGPDGEIYSIDGADDIGVSPVTYAYDPGTQAWEPVAESPVAVAAAAAGLVDGKIIVAGGYEDASGTPALEQAVQVFDPAQDTWSTAASLPDPRWASGAAVLDGKLYVVAGCTTSACVPEASSVFAYDPVSNSWTSVASYPIPVGFPACGAVGAELVCAGGEQGGQGLAAAYAYSPRTNKWTKIAPLPMDLYGSSNTAADGELLVSGGITDFGKDITNAAFAYHPGTNTWTALPAAGPPSYRGGGACGFDEVGGITVVNDAETLLSAAEQLPGYDQCNNAAPWLSASITQATVQPGQRIKVELTMNAGDASVTQPGSYTATLDAQDNTPYGSVPVGVTMTVGPPAAWGEITGTVRGAACDGGTGPLSGASVQINSAAGDHALVTDSSGRYVLWLDSRDDPLTVITGDQGWRPQAATAKVTAKHTTTLNITLKPSTACS